MTELFLRYTSVTKESKATVKRVVPVQIEA